VNDSQALGLLLVLLAVSVSGSAHGEALTLAQLRDLAKRTGFPDPALAAAIAKAESDGRPWVSGDNGESLGLWQIHWPAHPKIDRTRLLDPTYNAQAALSVSKKGTDWSPWTVYRDGSYRRFLPAASPR